VGEVKQWYSPELIAVANEVLGLEQADPAELEFADYQNEEYSERGNPFAPLITLEQLDKRPNLEIEWYCPDWIPVGSKTILSAEPKSGKTILLFHILNAITRGQSFLGKPCPPERVLYLTEQTEHEFKRQVSEVPGLTGNPNFYVLLAEETPQEIRTWEDTIAFCELMLAKTKAHILVIDTFVGLAKLPPNGENDAATIQNNINKLNRLFKNRYLSVVLVHHNRKKSDDPKREMNLSINSARGSSAFVGGGGHLIFMNAPDPKGRQRDFLFFGRYNHGLEMSLRMNQKGDYELIRFAANDFRRE